jgi:hypothetical protein
MGDKSRSSLISSRSAEQPASPIESWMGSLANILKLLATAVLPLRDRQTSASGPNRRLEAGQSMSDLPGYFRHRLVPLLPGRHPLRCPDI